MSSVGTLWLPKQPTHHLLAVAAYADLKVELPEDFNYAEDSKKPEYLLKFPQGKVPAFEGKDGFLLTEQYAIARYFAALAPNSNLLGATPQEAAQVDQWTAHSSSEVATHVYTALQLCKNILPYNKSLHTNSLEQLKRGTRTLDTHLASRTFLVGERITIADIAITAVLRVAFATFLDAAARKELPNLVRHFETVVNQPKLNEAFGGDGKGGWVEKALQFTPPAKEKK